MLSFLVGFRRSLVRNIFRGLEGQPGYGLQCVLLSSCLIHLACWWSWRFWWPGPVTCSVSRMASLRSWTSSSTTLTMRATSLWECWRRSFGLSRWSRWCYFISLHVHMPIVATATARACSCFFLSDSPGSRFRAGLADPNFRVSLHLVGGKVLQRTEVGRLAVAGTLLPSSLLHPLAMYEARPISNRNHTRPWQPHKGFPPHQLSAGTLR